MALLHESHAFDFNNDRIRPAVIVIETLGPYHGESDPLLGGLDTGNRIGGGAVFNHLIIMPENGNLHFSPGDNAFRLQLVNIIADRGVVEGIEESHIDGAVLGEELLHLSLVIGEQVRVVGDIDIGSAFPPDDMPLLVEEPKVLGREIEAHLHVILPAGLHESLHDVLLVHELLDPDRIIRPIFRIQAGTRARKREASQTRKINAE